MLLPCVALCKAVLTHPFGGDSWEAPVQQGCISKPPHNHVAITHGMWIGILRATFGHISETFSTCRLAAHGATCEQPQRRNLGLKCHCHVTYTQQEAKFCVWVVMHWVYLLQCISHTDFTLLAFVIIFLPLQEWFPSKVNSILNACVKRQQFSFLLALGRIYPFVLSLLNLLMCDIMIVVHLFVQNKILKCGGGVWDFHFCNIKPATP